VLRSIFFMSECSIGRMILFENSINQCVCVIETGREFLGWGARLGSVRVVSYSSVGIDMNGSMDRSMDGSIDGSMDGWMDGWMDRSMDGWTDGWTDRWIQASDSLCFVLDRCWIVLRCVVRQRLTLSITRWLAEWMGG